LSNAYFTADTHFGHAKIIKYCARPYDNVWEMNLSLINRWNLVVQPDDIVYHIGDFAFLPERQMRDVIECLNGRKILIRGNHDKSENMMRGIGFDEVYNFLQRHVDDQHIYMTHNPVDLNDSATPKSDLYLCGHIHTAWKSFKSPDKIVNNVGVDVWNFMPISVNEILTYNQNPDRQTSGTYIGDDHK